MTDPCDFYVQVRTDDASAFRRIVFGSEYRAEEPIEDRFPIAVYFHDSQADHAHRSGCEQAAKQGLVFEGRSGAGVQYNAARFCAIDGGFYHVGTFQDSSLVVRYHETERKVDSHSLAALEDYLNAFQRVRAILAERPVDDYLRRYPRICAHIIAESLGYALPQTAARILKDAHEGKENWCEWIYTCYRCDPRLAVRKAIQLRHYHKGYMASYELALKIVRREIATGESPELASWF